MRTEFDSRAGPLVAYADWPALKEAVTAKIQEQQAFVVIWDATGGINQSPGRGKTNAARHAFSVEQAQDEWGISQPAVSRDVTAFHPAQTREKLARLDGDIVKFRALKDWPALDEAVAADGM